MQEMIGSIEITHFSLKKPRSLAHDSGYVKFCEHTGRRAGSQRLRAHRHTGENAGSGSGSGTLKIAWDLHAGDRSNRKSRAIEEIGLQPTCRRRKIRTSLPPMDGPELTKDIIEAFLLHITISDPLTYSAMMTSVDSITRASTRQKMHDQQ